ncbi:MAG: hypothetical protein IT381_13860 [Deltaproteobacteria bacterium]|nr:hypothetical protein [Deltaproteobacteria bacterium]
MAAEQGVGAVLNSDGRAARVREGGVQKSDGVEVLTIEMEQELWELAASRVNEQCRKHPSGQTMINVAATLQHLAASSWLAFDQADGDGPPLTEDLFAQLAVQAYRRAVEEAQGNSKQRRRKPARHRPARARRSRLQ